MEQLSGVRLGWCAVGAIHTLGGPARKGYVFSTVLFATVLFFAGAVRPLVGPKLRTFMLLFATFLCVTALIRVVTTPVAR